ncbi:MAG: hypothetical protein HY543_08130 [Deltaproteobacteria bacterium]|nr:hypothetical protein [Deltaproteobacteria bacterium]
MHSPSVNWPRGLTRFGMRGRRDSARDGQEGPPIRGAAAPGASPVAIRECASGAWCDVIAAGPFDPAAAAAFVQAMRTAARPGRIVSGVLIIERLLFGHERFVVETFHRVAILAAETSASIHLVPLFSSPLERALPGGGDENADEAGRLHALRDWTQQVQTLIRGIPTAVLAILNAADGMSARYLPSIAVLQRAVQCFMGHLDRTLESLRAYTGADEEQREVRYLGHRLANNLPRLQLLQFWCGDYIAGRCDGAQFRQNVERLLPPPGLVELWRHLSENAEIHRRQMGRTVRCDMTPLPEIRLAACDPWDVASQLALLDEILAELVKNAVGYAATAVRGECSWDADGALRLRVRNDVAQPISDDDVAVLGRPGAHLPGIARNDSTHHGLATVVGMLRALRLPPLDLAVVPDADGRRWFRATVTIPGTRLSIG